MSRPFGFECGEFSVARSGNGIVMPGSKNQPLHRSLLPAIGDLNDAAGPYIARVTSEESTLDVPVRVLWVSHDSEPEPFLGTRSDDPEGLRSTLDALVGKRVRLEFTPLESN